MLSKQGRAALAYAQDEKFSVFPAHWARRDGSCSCGAPGCTNIGKHPLTPHGLYDATLDETAIRTWWDRHADANIAIRTGVVVDVLDIDPARGGLETIEMLESEYEKLPRTRTAATGGGGTHFYFATDPSCPLRSRADALGPGVDTRGHGGYVIAPPSNHSSGGRYEWVVEGPSQRLPDWIARRFAGLRLDQETKAAPLIDEVIELFGRTEGSRNDTLNRAAFKIGLRCASGEVTIPDAVDALTVAAGTTSPPMDAGEARGTIASGLRAGVVRGLARPTMRTRRPRLTRLDTAHMLRTPPPPVPWVIEPILAKGHLTCVAGPEGEGKSLLSLALGCSLAGGEPLAGFAPAEEGRVVVIDAENGTGEIHRRVRALGLTDRATDSITFFAAEAVDLRKDLEDLAALVDNEKPVLLVLDSFRSLWGGDENNSDEVAPVLDGLRNLGRSRNVAILLLHHTRKDGQTYRGSSAIGASVELMFVLGRVEGDSDPARRFLRCSKSRPAPEPSVRWIRLSAELDSTIIDDAEPPDNGPAEAEPVRNEVTRQVLDVLRDGRARRRADIARAVKREPKDRTVGRVLDALVSAGRIVRSTDGTYCCEQSGKVASPRSAPPCHPPRPKAEGTSAPGDAGCT